MSTTTRKLYRKAAGKLWRAVDRSFLKHAGGEQRPVFFDVLKTYPALRVIDENYDVIRAELEPVLERLERLPRYHDIDPRQEAISGGGPTNWRTLFLTLRAAGPSFPNRRLFPRTVAVLDQIPDLGEAFFSILEPGKSVPAHEGPNHYYLRYHTAFHVPRERPPTIRVKDERYTWKEGESVLFDDSWDHEVENHSDEVRIVLITDIFRPVPPHLRALLGLARFMGRRSYTDAEWAQQFECFKLPPEILD